MYIFNHDNLLYAGTEPVKYINYTKTASGIQLARTRFPETKDFIEPPLDIPEVKEAYQVITSNKLYKKASIEGLRNRVEVIIEDPKTGLFLVGQNPRHGSWVLPGGGIEEGEDIFEAAKREAEEETGYKIKPIEVLSKEPEIYMYNAPNSKGYIGSATTIVRAKLIKGKSKRYGADNDKLKSMTFLDPDSMKTVLETGDQAAAQMRIKYLPSLRPVSDTSKAATYDSFHVIDDEGVSLGEQLEKTALLKLVHKDMVKQAKGKVATVGQFLLNAGLPKELRDYNRIMDKKEMTKIMQVIAEKKPDLYKPISKHLYSLGDTAAVFDQRHLQYDDLQVKGPDKNKYFREAAKKFEIAKKTMPADKAINEVYNTMKEDLMKETIVAGGKNKNNLAIMAISGARGSPKEFVDITMGPVLVSDYKNRPIPVILDKGYAEGVTSAQSFAASYGTRRGMISTKLMVPLSGYMSKMLSWSTSNMVVTEKDCGTRNGIPYKKDDKWNIGKYLAKDGSLITETTIDNCKTDTIIVRSPITCEAKQGLCSKCLGHTEKGLAPIGYAAGINSSAGESEPLSQGMLSEKHTGGAVKKVVGGYPVIKRLVEIPGTFEDEAVLAEDHGTITKIVKLDWGGWDIYVGDKAHHTPQNNEPIVHVGDRVEKGDKLADGIVNPAKMTELRGFGEGRLNLATSLRNAFESAKMDLDRSHYEVTARALVNFADIHDNIGQHLPGETARLDEIKGELEPEHSEVVKVSSVEPYGKYLVKQYLQFSPGSEVTEAMKRTLKENGVNEIVITEDKPKFTPLMVRIQDTEKHDPDWVQRLGSQGLKDSLIKGVQRGDKSNTTGINYVHPYIHGQTFGRGQLY